MLWHNKNNFKLFLDNEENTFYHICNQVAPLILIKHVQDRMQKLVKHIRYSVLWK